MQVAENSALLTDYYELAMAQDYWQMGKSEQVAVFHLFLRRNPFAGEFTVFAGLEPVLEYLQNWRFTADDIDYLAGLQFTDGRPRFNPEFLRYLQALRLQIELFAPDEGTLMYAGEPLLRVSGPLLQCQILETALMNIINISSLVATKARRVRLAAPEDTAISEFGLRRAQGPNGGCLASRAAYIGGVGSTSNTFAGQKYGIPVLGTSAHSWVLSFDNELEAFRAAAKSMRENTVLLVDTFETIAGVKNAIQVAAQMANEGVILRAIRLDSGDLADLSQQARSLLDAAGLAECKIIASGDLDEYVIADLVAKGAAIDVWGVGTRLITAYDQPALDLAYKLSAIDVDGVWRWCAKKSSSAGKRTLPGILQVSRDCSGHELIHDFIYNIADVDSSYDSKKDLLKLVWQKGQLLNKFPSLSDVQSRVLGCPPKAADVRIDARLLALQQDIF